MPLALPWFQQKIGLDIAQTSYSQVGKLMSQFNGQVKVLDKGNYIMSKL